MRLSGSVEDQDTGQAVTYEWSKIWGPDVTLHESDTLTPYFDAPDDSAIFIWKLTVRDPLGAEHSDNVWVFVDYTPDTQWEDWAPVVPPSYQGSGALRKQHYTRNGVYLLPSIDEEGNARTDRIPANSSGTLTSRSTTQSATRSTTRSTTPGSYVPTVADPFNPGRPEPEYDWFSAPDRPPVANAGLDKRVDTGITVYLNGLDSQDGFGGTGTTDEHGDLEYNWEAPSTAGITIQDANTGSPYFLAPETVGAITVSLTVTNSIGLSDTDTVTINVVDTWGPWRDVVVNGDNVYDGEGAERRKKQVSTSELGNTKYRWVPDPNSPRLPMRAPTRPFGPGS